MLIFKKILFIFILALSAASPISARENVNYWYVKDLRTEINVNKDASLDITEWILADCGLAPGKHGIFRILPKKYKTQDGNFDLPLELISISDGQGNKLKYSVINNSDTVTYKIGDPEVTVRGENMYEIKYHIKNAIRTERASFDEFYWNILGNYWDMDIDNFSARINFPEEVNQGNTQLSYYTGSLNSKGSNLVTSRWTGNNSLEFFSSQSIQAGQGVSVSVTFPKGIVTPYRFSFEDRYGFSFLSLFLALLFPIITFIICYRLWKKHGRDPRLNRSIAPEFEIPENLSPIEMSGVMVKSYLKNSSITASIINLGVLGYLKIEEIEEKLPYLNGSDFKLIRTDKAIGNDIHKAETLILDKVFKDGPEVRLTELKKRFYIDLPEISNELSRDLKDRDLINKKSGSYQTAMFIIGVLSIIPGFIVAAFSIMFLASLLSCSIIIILFAIFMDKLTLKGAELNHRIKGFKLYMDTAEKYRSRFQEQEGIMDKLLPYAILFGITKQWLKKMKDIYGEEYFSSYHPAFMAGTLASANFDDFLSTVNTLSTSISSNISPSSSGAGGSGGAGGGAGGGGGGGW